MALFMTVIAIFSGWEQNGSVIIQSKTVLAFMTYMVKGMLDELRDGPLEKLWGGGEGNFRAAGIFFRYQIPGKNFF